MQQKDEDVLHWVHTIVYLLYLFDMSGHSIYNGLQKYSIKYLSHHNFRNYKKDTHMFSQSVLNK